MFRAFSYPFFLTPHIIIFQYLFLFQNSSECVESKLYVDVRFDVTYENFERSMNIYIENYI